MNRSSYLGLSLSLTITALAGLRGAGQAPPGSPTINCSAPAVSLTPQRSLSAHQASLHSLAYSRDGKLLASAGEDGTVKLWAAHTGRRVRILHVSTRCVAFSPDGRWLATGNYDFNLGTDAYDHPAARLVKVWSVRSGRVVRELAGHKEPVKWVAWSPDARFLASASTDGSVKLWRASTWRLTASLQEPFPDLKQGDHVTAKEVLFSPDGRALAVVSVASYHGEPGTGTSRVVLWRTATWKRERMLLDQPRCWNAIVAFTRDNRRLVAATEGFPSGGDVYSWDLPSGRKKTLAAGVDASYAATLVPPGRWFAAGGKEWTAFLLDLRNGEAVAGLPHTAEVMAMAASPDGRTLATGDARGVIRFWAMPPPSERAARGPGRRAAASTIR